MCLQANKNNLNGNKHNQIIILNIKERWNNLKLIIKDKIFKIQNVWLLLCDLTDQIENFNLIINKTETFYRNTILLTESQAAASINLSSSIQQSLSANIIFKLIEELYDTIKDDYKLIKYLNESYVNFAKSVNNFELFEHLEKFKQKLLSINSRWDSLHNEIAIKIKLVIINFF